MTQRADEGLAWFAGAIRLTTSYALAHRNLALATAHNGRTDESIPHFARAVALNLIARRKFEAMKHVSATRSVTWRVTPLRCTSLAPPSAPERMAPPGAMACATLSGRF